MTLNPSSGSAGAASRALVSVALILSGCLSADGPDKSTIDPEGEQVTDLTRPMGSNSSQVTASTETDDGETFGPFSVDLDRSEYLVLHADCSGTIETSVNLSVARSTEVTGHGAASLFLWTAGQLRTWAVVHSDSQETLQLTVATPTQAFHKGVSVFEGDGWARFSFGLGDLGAPGAPTPVRVAFAHHGVRGDVQAEFASLDGSCTLSNSKSGTGAIAVTSGDFSAGAASACASAFVPVASPAGGSAAGVLEFLYASPAGATGVFVPPSSGATDLSFQNSQHESDRLRSVYVNSLGISRDETGEISDKRALRFSSIATDWEFRVEASAGAGFSGMGARLCLIPIAVST